VIGTPGCAGAETHSVRLTWKSPNVGGATAYVVYRVAGTALTPGLAWTQVGTAVTAVVGQDDYALLDRAQLQNGQSYTYFSIAIYGEGVQSDPSNLVTIVAINDGPTLSSIANQTIQVNSTTGPLSFTIGDEDPASVAVAGGSSNPALVPNANIVFAGTGATRTVTVTPAAGQFGTATITLAPTDGAGNAGTPASFLLTVQSNPYLFRGFISTLATAGTESAPSDSGVVTRGSLLVKWQVGRDLAFVKDLTSTRSLVAIPGNTLNNPLCLANGASALTLVTDGQASGGTFIYDTANNRFQFTWNTSAISTANCYRLSLSLDDGSAPRVTIVRFQ